MRNISVCKHQMTKWVVLVLLSFAFIYLPVSSVKAASELEDGKYTIDYEMLQGDSDSVSISNDYWLKPATLIVKDGKITVQHGLKNSSWVVGYQVENNGSISDTKTISTDAEADKRTVQFQVSALDKPTTMKIHVIVESINYDHKYSVRMSYKTDTLKLVEADKKEEAEVVKPTTSQSVEKAEDTTKPTATTSGETKQSGQQSTAEQSKETPQPTKEPSKQAGASASEVKEPLEMKSVVEEKDKAQSAESGTNEATTVASPNETSGVEQDDAEAAAAEGEKESSDNAAVADADLVVDAQEDGDSSAVSDQAEDNIAAKELEIKELEKEKKTWLWITLIVIVIASFAGGAFRYYKAKRK